MKLILQYFCQRCPKPIRQHLSLIVLHSRKFFHKGEIFVSIIRIDKYSVYTRCAIWITGRKCKFIAFLSLTNTWYYLFYVARKKIKKTFWFVVCSWFCGSAHLHDIQSLFSSTFFSFSCCLFCFVCKESLDRFPLS